MISTSPCPEIFEAIAVLVTIRRHRLAFCSVYVPKPSTAAFEALEQYIFSVVASYPNMLVCGDFNSHHPVWGGKKTSSHAPALLQAIVSNKLTILNDTSVATWHSHSSDAEGVLDLSLVSPSLLPLVKFKHDDKPEWSAFTTGFSDHDAIKISKRFTYECQIQTPHHLETGRRLVGMARSMLPRTLLME